MKRVGLLRKFYLASCPNEQERIGADGLTLGIRAISSDSPGFRTIIAEATGAHAAGAVALGALAIGGLAIGFLAIGRLVIRELLVRQVHLRHLKIDQLDVEDLRVKKLTVSEEQRPARGPDSPATGP